MNREQLQRLASEWVRVAKNDIRKKVIDFINEVDTTPRELAYHLAMSEGELQQIIEGNGEISITTLAKLLIATGNALEIKPIEETPMGEYGNIPDEMEFEHPLPRPNMPRPNVFERQCSQEACHPRFSRPTFSRDNDDIPPMPSHLREEFERRFGEAPENHQHQNVYERQRPTQPRDEHGRFMSPTHETQTSPFESKSTNELVKIIKERLWDTEIDLNAATKAELVKFLDEKNKRMSEYKRIKELEEDPKVNEFKNRMKNTLRVNPHLREWFRNFVGEIDN